MKAILVTRPGGPEVLELADVPDPLPGNGELLYAIAAAAVNYADTHQTEGTYLRRRVLPFTPGLAFLGYDPDGVRVIGLVREGAYAEKVTALPRWTGAVPDTISDDDALAVGLHGVSAWYVLRVLGRLGRGESVAIHAAAGGVGSFAVQLARRWGAGRVIGVASTDVKRRIAQELGAHATVDANTDDLTAALLAANDGRPLDVVLEMTGGRAFDASLLALNNFGRLVTYGNASRVLSTPIQAESLMDGARTVSGFWFSSLTADACARARTALFAMVAAGELSPLVGGRYPLHEVRRAHEDLVARRTVGVQTLQVR